MTDPYEIWKFYSRQGFNLYSNKGENIERLTKPLNFIFHQAPQTIIFGSSRADYSLDPNSWKMLTGRETYNFAVTSGTLYEMRRYFEHALENDERLEEIIICVDFYTFVDNETHQAKSTMAGYDDEQIGKKIPTLTNLQKTLFSWESLKDGVTNSLDNMRNKYDFPCHDLNGKFSEGYIAQKYKDNSDEKFLNILRQWQRSLDFSSAYLNEESFQEFQRVINLCRAQNIKLSVCILPLYPLHYEAFNDCWSVYESWKVKLVSMTPVVDFTCFDSDIAERENFWDTSHAKKIIGDRVLFALADEIRNENFGEILTIENIKAHNEKIRRDRKNWRCEHWQEIENILEK